MRAHIRELSPNTWPTRAAESATAHSLELTEDLRELLSTFTVNKVVPRGYSAFTLVEW
jgi:hypothetical protein